MSEGKVEFKAPGKCVIDANQAGNSEWEAAPDESFEAFRARAKAAAEAEGVRYIIFGGLPNVSWMPTDYEIQADAGARGLNSSTSA